MLRRDCEGAREGHEEGSRFVSKSLSCFLSRVARHLSYFGIYGTIRVLLAALYASWCRV